jgi:purine-binding chemotaxis protein CheW
MGEDTIQFCSFYLERHLFGVQVSEVQEILRYQDPTTVPIAPPVIRGLMNLRGQIVAVLDLRRRLGLPERLDQTRAFNVIVRAPEGAVSLLVDRVGEVLNPSAASFEEPPLTLRGIGREFIRGAYKLEGALLLHLATDKVLDLRANGQKSEAGNT